MKAASVTLYALLAVELIKHLGRKIVWTEKVEQQAAKN